MLLTPKVSKYRVVRGDSLWKISEAQYGNPTVWPQVSQANRLPNADLILVGMLLNLPPVNARPYHPRKKATTQVRPPYIPPVGPGLGTSSVPSPMLLRQTGGNFQLDPHQAKNYGTRPAIPVVFPAVKYKLDDFAPLVVSTPAADFSLRFIGEVTLQQKGTMTEVELSQRGTLSEKIRADYKSKLADLSGSVKIGLNSQTREVQVSCGFSVAAKVDGHVFATSQYDFFPPNRFKYSYKPAPIQGEQGDTVFTGSVGFELEVIIKKPDSPPSPEPLHSPQRSTTWAWVVAGALVVAGAAIIVADIAKDVGTVGIGAVESPVSFAAAGALFTEAATMVP